MDESRARALLRAERAEVATLLRQTEEAATLDDQASDIPEDFTHGPNGPAAPPWNPLSGI